MVKLKKEELDRLKKLTGMWDGCLQHIYKLEVSRLDFNAMLEEIEFLQKENALLKKESELRDEIESLRKKIAGKPLK